jgi:hypothetical protein
LSDAMQAAASPIEVEIKGRKYQISPLRHGDFCDFEAAVVSRRMQILQATIPSQEERIRVAQELLMADPKSMAGPEMSSYWGMRWQIWKSLIRNHPELTEEEVGDLISTDNVSELMAILNSISIPGETEESAKKKRAAGAGLATSRKSSKSQATRRRK